MSIDDERDPELRALLKEVYEGRPPPPRPAEYSKPSGTEDLRRDIAVARKARADSLRRDRARKPKAHATAKKAVRRPKHDKLALELEKHGLHNGPLERSQAEIVRLVQDAMGARTEHELEALRTLIRNYYKRVTQDRGD
jgi:hypothetical protein